MDKFIMEQHRIDFMTIYYEQQDNQHLPLYEDACRNSAPIIRQFTGLQDPDHCKVYILRHWRKFLFHAVSLPEKVIYALVYPLWQARIRKQWPLIGGWAMSEKSVFGVKSPPLYALADRSLGEKIFIEDKDLERKVRGAICHELTHVYCGHLKLPLWLNEGLALLSTDLYVGKQTVKPETILTMQQYMRKEMKLTYRNMSAKSIDDIAYQYNRGYWIVRYIMLKNVGKIKLMLQRKRSEAELVSMLADWFGIPAASFWREIDSVLAETFPNGTGEVPYPETILTHS